MEDLETIKQKIYSMILEYHNPSLVIPEESPNGNTIYHLYSDGEITYQKGGFAYLNRTEFPDESAIDNNNNNNNRLDINNFPLIRHGNNNVKYGYLIATRENCIAIRNEMLKL